MITLDRFVTAANHQQPTLHKVKVVAGRDGTLQLKTSPYRAWGRTVSFVQQTALANNVGMLRQHAQTDARTQAELVRAVAMSYDQRTASLTQRRFNLAAYSPNLALRQPCGQQPVTQQPYASEIKSLSCRKVQKVLTYAQDFATRNQALFHRLPIEVVEKIAPHLDEQTLDNLAQTNRGLRKAITPFAAIEKAKQIGTLLPAERLSRFNAVFTYLTGAPPNVAAAALPPLAQDAQIRDGLIALAGQLRHLPEGAQPACFDAIFQASGRLLEKNQGYVFAALVEYTRYAPQQGQLIIGQMFNSNSHLPPEHQGPCLASLTKYFRYLSPAQKQQVRNDVFDMNNSIPQIHRSRGIAGIAANLFLSPPAHPLNEFDQLFDANNKLDREYQDEGLAALAAQIIQLPQASRREMTRRFNKVLTRNDNLPAEHQGRTLAALIPQTACFRDRLIGLDRILLANSALPPTVQVPVIDKLINQIPAAEPQIKQAIFDRALRAISALPPAMQGPLLRDLVRNIRFLPRQLRQAAFNEALNANNALPPKLRITGTAALDDVRRRLRLA